MLDTTYPPAPQPAQQARPSSSLSSVQAAPRTGRAMLAWGCFFIIVLVAAAMRVVWFNGESLDSDELFSLNVSKGQFAADLRTMEADIVHPPLYYFMIRPVIALLGANALGLRLVSMIAGLILVAMIMLWVKKLTRQWPPALLAGALVAVSYHQIYYSQQGRSYAVYALLIAAMVATLDRALAEDRREWWLSFVIVGTAAVLTHYIAAIFVAATFPAVVMRPDRRKLLWKWALAVTFMAASLVPWLFAVLPFYRANGGLGPNLDWIGIPSWYELRWIFAEFNGNPNFRFAGSLSLIVLAAIAALAVRRFASRQPEGSATVPSSSTMLLLGSVTLIPPIVLFLATRRPLSLTIWGLRHLLPAQALLVVVTSVTLWSSLRNRLALSTGFAVLLGLQLMADRALLDGPVRVPYHRVAAYIGDRNPTTTEVYGITRGIARPVNFYLGRTLVRPLPVGLDSLGNELWVVYREQPEAEARPVRRIMEAGWRVHSRANFGGDWGATVVHLLRPAEGPADPRRE